MVCHFFADSTVLTFGDTKDNKPLKDGFYKMIKESAKEFGYKTVN